MRKALIFVALASVWAQTTVGPVTQIVTGGTVKVTGGTLLAQSGTPIILGGTPVIGGGGGGPTNVTFDNSCFSVTSPDGTSISCSLTIGSISKGAVAVGFVQTGPPTSTSCTVGGVTAPLVSGSSQTASVGGETFGLATGSTAGATTIACNWTGGGAAALGAISVSGANQTTPFVNGNHAAAGSGTPTVVITSATGHLTFSVGMPNVMPTANSQTAFFSAANGSSVWFGGQYGAGAATVTHSWTVGSAALWVVTGTDIQP